MRGRHTRYVALLLLLAMMPLFTGCGGGLVELALTASRLYGGWRLYKVFDDGTPSWISLLSAVFRFDNDWTYGLDYVDQNDDPVESETGTWSIDNGVLVLTVDQSTIDPSAVGKTLRLPGHLKGDNQLSLTRRVTTGQVTVSQEQVYRRQPPPT